MLICSIEEILETSNTTYEYSHIFHVESLEIDIVNSRH